MPKTMLVLILAVAVIAIIAAVAAHFRRSKNDEASSPPRVGMTETMGRGMFATRAYKQGDLVDECPLLVKRNDKWGEAAEDYIFTFDKKRSALALGNGSLYNHADDYNVEHEIDTVNRLMKMRAVRDIAPGEQLFITYGDDWFQTRDVEKI